jgi:hypothetical protein
MDGLRKLALLTFVSPILASCAVLDSVNSGSAWDEGEFTSTIKDGKEIRQVKIVCSKASGCQTVAEAVRAGDSPDIFKTTQLQRYPFPEIVNNNLVESRRKVKADPKRYEGAGDAEIARLIRPVLNSQAQIAECLALQQDKHSGTLLLCRLNDKGEGYSNLLLAIGVLAPTCGNSLFCPYYFFPVEKKK